MENRFSLHEQLDSCVRQSNSRHNPSLFRMTISLDLPEDDVLLITEAARLWALYLSNFNKLFRRNAFLVQEEIARDTCRILNKGETDLTLDDLLNVERGINAWANLDIFEGSEIARNRARSDLDECDPLMLDLPKEIGYRLFDVVAAREEQLKFKQARSFLEDFFE